MLHPGTILLDLVFIGGAIIAAGSIAKPRRPTHQTQAESRRPHCTAAKLLDRDLLFTENDSSAVLLHADESNVAHQTITGREISDYQAGSSLPKAQRKRKRSRGKMPLRYEKSATSNRA